MTKIAGIDVTIESNKSHEKVLQWKAMRAGTITQMTIDIPDADSSKREPDGALANVEADLNPAQVTFMGSNSSEPVFVVNPALDLYDRRGRFAALSGGVFAEEYRPIFDMRSFFSTSDGGKTGLIFITEYIEAVNPISKKLTQVPVTSSGSLACELNP